MPDTISATFSALADPTRRAILARLVSGEATVTELAEPFRMSMPAVSKHLRVLERAGLVARGREAQWRPVSLRAEPLQQAAEWLEAYRQFWEHSFDRLDAYLQRLQDTEMKRVRPATGQQKGKQQARQQTTAKQSKQHRTGKQTTGSQLTGGQSTGSQSKEKRNAGTQHKK